MERSLASRSLVAIAIVATISLSACRGDRDAGADNDSIPASTNDTTYGTPDAADTATTPPAGSATATTSDANIVAKLSAMDSAEIELGRLATSKAQDAGVKAFAQMMVDDHTAMRNDGAAMAQSEGITPVLPADHTTPHDLATALDRLRSTDATSFDRAYIDQMVADHQKAVSTINGMISQAQNAALRAHLQKGLPRVQAHLDKVMQLQQKVSTTAAK
jgi:putative membrane protein